MTYDFTVHVMSARRHATLVEKTMPLLRKYGIEDSEITVWVCDEEELATYTQHLAANEFFPNFDVAPHNPDDQSTDTIGIEPITIGRGRNWIIRAIGSGQRALFLDDDIRHIRRAISPKELIELPDLRRFISEAFRDAEAASATLWGIYPVDNPYFMKPRHRYGLSYICGGMFGVYTTGQEHELVTLDDKEDYERSIRHYLRDTTTMRIESVCLSTTGYAGSGGMQASRTPERVRLSAEWLAATYPHLCSINRSKKSEWAEVRLRDVRLARRSSQ